MGKKNGSFGRDYGKVVGKSNSDFPGWKGPGYVPKKAELEKKSKLKQKPAPVEESVESESEPEVSVEQQQVLLNIFKDNFSDLLTSDDLKPTLQEVKAALYERDFTRAFGKEEYLEAYSVRWSPSRALAYHTILVDIRDHLRELSSLAKPDSSTKAGVLASRPGLRSVCFGGGAAEVVAFGGYVRYLRDAEKEDDTADKFDGPSISEGPNSKGLEDGIEDASPVSLGTSKSYTELLLLDCAKWEGPISILQAGLTSPPAISKYASSAARAANLKNSLVSSSSFSTSFRLSDALTLSQAELASIIGQTPQLITLLFTLNELYTTSIAKTTAYLLKLTIAAQPGTLLLVVDSPGNYSETSVGSGKDEATGEKKKYPMHWLLDHTMMGSSKVKSKPAGEEEGKAVEEGKEKETKADWVKLVSEDSKWFRIPAGLSYPIPLENMRYQIHLYRRV